MDQYVRISGRTLGWLVGRALSAPAEPEERVYTGAGYLPSKEYMEYWRGVYQGYEKEVRQRWAQMPVVRPALPPPAPAYPVSARAPEPAETPGGRAGAGLCRAASLLDQTKLLMDAAASRLRGGGEAGTLRYRQAEDRFETARRAWNDAVRGVFADEGELRDWLGSCGLRFRVDAVSLLDPESRPPAAPRVREFAPRPKEAPTAPSALTPSQAGAAESWDSLPLRERAGRLAAMGVSERVVTLARYLAWKSARGEMGDPGAEEAKAQLAAAQRWLEAAAREKTWWRGLCAPARALDEAVGRYAAAEAAALSSPPAGRTAAYRDLAARLRAVNTAKEAMYAAAKDLLRDPEEIDAFSKWCLPKTKLSLRSWLTPGPWRTSIVAPETPAPAAPPPPPPRPGPPAPMAPAEGAVAPASPWGFPGLVFQPAEPGAEGFLPYVPGAYGSGMVQFVQR